MMLIVLAAGCSPSASPTIAATTAPTASAQAAATPKPTGEGTLATTLSETYTDALSVRNQLALGTLRLEGTPDAIAPEQAEALHLYWQALLALSTSTTTAPEETTAIQTQIIETMTPVQIKAIAAMQLTNADLTAFYAEQGVALVTPVPGVTPQGGRNSGLSQQDREATRTAAEAAGTPVGTGSGGAGSDRREILIDAVIALLGEKLAAQ